MSITNYAEETDTQWADALCAALTMIAIAIGSFIVRVSCLRAERQKNRTIYRFHTCDRFEAKIRRPSFMLGI
jgi:hypothetical protein